MTPALRITFVMLALSGCGLPEDSNPALRCDDDLSCPDGLYCYRGYCIDDDDARNEETIVPVTAVGDASIVSHPTGDAASDAGASASSDDGAESIVHDVPGGPAVTTTEPTVTTPVTTPTTPVVTQPKPPSSLEPVACFNACSLNPSAKSCTDCVKNSFGTDTKKLCRAVSPLPAISTLCGVLCAAVDPKGHGPTLSCADDGPSCQGADCKGQ